MQKIGEYEADLKNKPTTKGKKYLLEIHLCEVVERDMIKLIKCELALAERERERKPKPICVKNKVDDMRKLFSPFGTRTEQYVKVKRENESE